MARVSIVMPVYNGEKYLKQSVNSILNQTYTDWELIFVNDCSTDGSLEIMKSYNDERIKIISNSENKRLPQSLNIGFAVAEGEYFTWTSDDNEYACTAIADMVEFLDKNPDFGMVYCDMEHIDENGGFIKNVSYDINKLYSRSSIGASFMYRSEAARVTGEYDPNMFLVEDYDYWLRINHNYEIGHLAINNYKYRLHKNSLTSTKRNDVKKQLHKLYIRETDFIVSKIDKENKQYLFCTMAVFDPCIYDTLKEKFYGGDVPERLKWLSRKNQLDDTKPIILFGAGNYGKEALSFFGEDRVYCFADNSKNKIGKEINGKKIISFDELVKIADAYNIVISMYESEALIDVANQFDTAGIHNYTVYLTYMLG